MSILEVCIVIMEEVSAVSTEVFFFFFVCLFVISMQGLMKEGEICNLKESNYSDLLFRTIDL